MKFFIYFTLSLVFFAIFHPDEVSAECGLLKDGQCTTNNYVDVCEGPCQNAGYTGGTIGCTPTYDEKGYYWCSCDDGTCTGPENCPAVKPAYVCTATSGGTKLGTIPPYLVCGGGGFDDECCSEAEECQVPPGECRITFPNDCLVTAYPPGPCDPENNPDHDISYCVQDSPTSATYCICSSAEYLGLLPTPYIPPIYCKSMDPEEGGTTESDTRRIWTALGCVRTTTVGGFTVDFLSLGLAIGGGIALLMIAIAGIIIKTSVADPQRVQMGWNLAFGALAAILMMVFSVFMLRFIGVDVLHIPGL